MKTVLIDCGNSRVKWAYLEPTTSSLSSVYTAEYPITHALADLVTVSVQKIWVANVAGSKVAKDLKCFSQRVCNIQPIFLKSERSSFGILNGYTKPSQLGIDRWLAMIAASQQYAGPFMVVSVGTCVTVDIVADKKHIQGFIVPGFQLMQDSIRSRTKVRIEKALETKTAVLAGIMQMHVAFLERLYHDFKKKFPDVSFVITGGDSARLGERLQIPFTIASDLVLKGLALFASRKIFN